MTKTKIKEGYDFHFSWACVEGVEGNARVIHMLDEDSVLRMSARVSVCGSKAYVCLHPQSHWCWSAMNESTSSLFGTVLFMEVLTPLTPPPPPWPHLPRHERSQYSPICCHGSARAQWCIFSLCLICPVTLFGHHPRTTTTTLLPAHLHLHPASTLAWTCLSVSITAGAA